MEWLGDSTPRVILIDKEFDFIGSEGTATSEGCERKDCPVSAGGQDFIGTLSCSDRDKMTPVASIEYDVAGTKPMKVGSNKSLVGVGSEGVISGKGLTLNGASNVIIQNIHFTNINPKSVWGGDGITLQNTDLIWIDHCKFSLTGRQFIVSGWDPAGRVTISNSEFDGNTNWSNSCNGQHYWALLFIGADDLFTFSGNYLHHVSGRAPHYGTADNSATNVFHAVNNLFESIDGHAFDVEPSTWTLIEGNVFNGVKQTVSAASTTRDNSIYLPVDGSACTSVLGRACETNLLDGSSGALPSVENADALTRLAQDGGSDIAPAMAASDVEASVLANAGVGKISASDSTTPPSTPSSPDPSSESPATPSAIPSEAPVATPVPSEPSTPPPASGVGATMWGQCGGIAWTGATTCAEGTCQEQNEWFWQCV